MEKMLVTEALNELKTLDKRIDKEIELASFVEYAKISEKKVNSYTTKDDFAKDALAKWQSINDLINRRERIKAAVVESNARTNVEICGNTYTVAKVIDMKTSLTYKADLLHKMECQYKSAVANVNTCNSKMETKIDELVATAFGKESKTSVKPDDYDSIAVPYRTANEFSLVDPLGISNKIDELRNFIDEFNATVDSKLQISNCVTYIEF